MSACPASFRKLVVARVTRGSELVTVCRQFLWFCSAQVTAMQDSCYFSSEPKMCRQTYLLERCLLSACSRPPAGVWSALPGFVVASWDTEGDVPSPAALPQLLAPPVHGRCPRAAAFLRVPSRNSPWAQRWLKLAKPGSHSASVSINVALSRSVLWCCPHGPPAPSPNPFSAPPAAAPSTCCAHTQPRALSWVWPVAPGFIIPLLAASTRSPAAADGACPEILLWKHAGEICAKTRARAWGGAPGSLQSGLSSSPERGAARPVLPVPGMLLNKQLR